MTWQFQQEHICVPNRHRKAAYPHDTSLPTAEKPSHGPFTIYTSVFILYNQKQLMKIENNLVSVKK